jgi:hypothetical protein
MLTERRGNRQTARETEKESVRENKHCGKTDVGVHHKTGHWKTPLASFWDELGRINIFWETILMEERDRKDTLRLNILRNTLGDNWYNMLHILNISLQKILFNIFYFKHYFISFTARDVSLKGKAQYV